MAEIVKARDTSPPGDRLVAIKRILPHLCDDQQYRAMFLDESRVLAQLEHASIIEAFEIGEIDDTPYIALDYIHGQDARELFHETRHQGQRIPIGVACYIVARVCEGLHHAHEQTDESGQLLGIVHRDVSLQNILLSYDGDVRLTDFGIAASVNNESRTDLGVVKGKFGYMSPEQIRGATLDRRADVFAVGICLYELLTGERLFSGENDYKAVERVRNADVQPPSELNRQIPSSLERIVMKSLAKQPRDRYQSTNDLRRALQGFLAETNEFVGSEDLARLMQSTFATALAADGMAPRMRVSDKVTAIQPAADQAAGLRSFDDLEPVSALHYAPNIATAPATGSRRTERASGRATPAVPPLIPRANSIPASAPGRPVSLVGGMPPPPRADAGWDDDEPTTVSPGYQDIPKSAASPLGEVGNEEVTRELLAGDTVPGLAALRGEFASSKPVSSSRSRNMPTLEILKAPTPLVPALVAGVLAAVALVVIVYLVRGRGAGTLRLETEPKDATVFVDGKSVGTLSPFVAPALSASATHTVIVEKSGYMSWSTRLRVRPDKIFELPLVRLEPIQPLASPLPPVLAAPRVSVPEPVRHSAPVGAASAKVEHKTSWREAIAARRAARPAKESRPAPVPTRPAPAATRAVPAATRPANTQTGTGTLRINTRPWSQVSIDGRLVGNTPQMNLKLSAGSHTVTLRNPDFDVTKKVVIDIKPDTIVTRVLTLTP